MVSFYAMIVSTNVLQTAFRDSYLFQALVAWWYPGQNELEELFQSICLAVGAEGGAEGGEAAGGH